MKTGTAAVTPTAYYLVFDPHWRQYLSIGRSNGWAEHREEGDRYQTPREAYAALQAAEQAYPYRSDLYVIKRDQVS